MTWHHHLPLRHPSHTPRRVHASAFLSRRHRDRRPSPPQRDRDGSCGLYAKWDIAHWGGRWEAGHRRVLCLVTSVTYSWKCIRCRASLGYGVRRVMLSCHCRGARTQVLLRCCSLGHRSRRGRSDGCSTRRFAWAAGLQLQLTHDVAITSSPLQNHAQTRVVYSTKSL